MKAIINTFLTAGLLFGIFTNCSGQSYEIQTVILKQTFDKCKAIQTDYRVVEKTFSEYLFKADTTITNHYFRYSFSASKTYHITGLSPFDYVSVLKVMLYKYDTNNKLQFVGSNKTATNEVDLTFKPTESGDYFIVVEGTLKGTAESAFFSIIIDRE